IDRWRDLAAILKEFVVMDRRCWRRELRAAVGVYDPSAPRYTVYTSAGGGMARQRDDIAAVRRGRRRAAPGDPGDRRLKPHDMRRSREGGVRRLLIARLGIDAQIRAVLLARREALPAPAHRPSG